MWAEEIKTEKTKGYLEKLRKFRGIHSGESCIIMGSGPSLKSVPIEFLKQYKTIAINGAFRYMLPDYMVTLDPSFPDFFTARQNCTNFNIPFFINWYWLEHTHAEDLNQDFENEIPMPWYQTEWNYTENNTKLINHIKRCYEDQDYFERNGSSVMCSGAPELAIPLARYMGFEKIYLIGIDFTSNVTKENHHFDNIQEEYDKVSWVRWNTLVDGNKYGAGGLWDVKRFSLEIIAETNIADKVFNLSEISTIQNIEKVHYSEIK